MKEFVKGVSGPFDNKLNLDGSLILWSSVAFFFIFLRHAKMSVEVNRCVFGNFGESIEPDAFGVCNFAF